MAKSKISEAEFTKQVIKLAKLYGWRVAHFRKVRVMRKNGSIYWETPVQANGKGWPDLFMVRDGNIIVAELKVGNNGITPEQREWILDFDACHADSMDKLHVRIWRPEMWDDIEALLK